MTRGLRFWLCAALTIVVYAAGAPIHLDAIEAAPPASAPALLSALPRTSQVTLTWGAVSSATRYRIYRGVNGVYGPNPIASVERLEWSDYNVTNGTTYGYRVAASNINGTGPMSVEVLAMPLETPTQFIATAGDHEVSLTWFPSPAATIYRISRSTVGSDGTFTVVGNVTTTSFVDTGLTNQTRYFYRVRALAANGSSTNTPNAWATPMPPRPAAPTNLTASPGNARVRLTWDPVPRATLYRIWRSTTPDITDDMPYFTSVSVTTYTNTGLQNGVTYYYRVKARNVSGGGPLSDVASATPLPPPPAPRELRATPADGSVSLTWNPSETATSYSVYRTATPGDWTAPARVTGLTSPAYVDTIVHNGRLYYYRVSATNAGGESRWSHEVNATPEVRPPPVDPEIMAAYRLLRQATWGPRPGAAGRIKAMGADAFIAQQFAAPASTYPASLYSRSVEDAQEYFMQLALNGPDQLRQRVAWALHKIWVVSAVEVNDTPAFLTYYSKFMTRAFGNYRDLMRVVTLNPAMGSYLNMVNNRSQQVTGVPANENYARELMQLFTLGTAKLNDNGTPMLDANGVPIPTYTEDDVKALARILTGWTFGDGNAATIPTRRAYENFRVPMEAVERYHDSGAKTFLGETFPAGRTAAQDLEHALDVIFNHPNVGPFISRQLIQQLVTSNPSPAYVGAVAAVFNGGGSGERGDLAAVVRAILTHPEASAGTTPGKLAEPVFFIVSMLRAFDATVTDHPFMSDKAADMGQRVFYPPSVFSYFSPGYRVRGTGTPPLGGPEFQILTSVTALERANFVADLLGHHFGTDVTIDFTSFNALSDTPLTLVEYCNRLFMGGRMSVEERAEIAAAVRAISPAYYQERVRTALYLTLVTAQAQVDR